MTTQNKEAFGWGDKVDVPDSGGYVLLPEGPAVFEIIKLEKARKPFGQFGTINVAVLTLLCSPVDGNESAEIKTQLGLHLSLGWKIVQLATACGLRKHGDSNEIDPRWWAQFVGAGGRCEIKHREYKGNKGDMLKANEIARFMDPAEPGPAATATDNATEFDNIPF
jgi:hypothetical protein